jgi:hypothetical protein
MAKNREERYQSTEDMLEDLRAVRRGEPPTHARRAVHIDGLTKLEETGKTVDLAPSAAVAPMTWGSPAVLAVLVALAVSVVVNFILLAMTIARK